ncbi:MAG: lipopolysaccharide biosynthesis protein [Hyphomicrobium sp.]
MKSPDRGFDETIVLDGSRSGSLSARTAQAFAAVASGWAVGRRIVGAVMFPVDERTRVQRDALLAFAVRVASAAIIYLSQVILARWMGSHEYGVYVFVWTWVLVLGGLSALGFAGASLRLLPQYRETGETDLARGLLFGGRLMALASGTMVAAAGVCGLWLLGDAVAEPYILPAYLALVCVPLYSLTDMQDGVARSGGWMALALVPIFVLRPIIILAGMALAHEAGLPMTATTAAAAAIAAVWISAILQVILLNRRLQSTAPSGPRRYAFRQWLTVSLPLVAVYACELVMQNADVLVVSHVMSPSDVAVYFASAKTMSLILFVHYAVGSAIAARFSALKARGDTIGLEAFVADAANWTFWPSLAGAALILALGHPLLSLFGPEFEAGYPIMGVLVLGFLLRSAVGPADILLNMLGEQKICAALLAVTALLNVTLNLLLVPEFGLLGAAFATSSAIACGALMSYVAARRRLGLDVAIWHNLRR